MTGEGTYKFLVDYLVDLLENTSARGMGAKDGSVNKLTEAELCEVFERYIYDDMVSYFLINKSERLQVFNGRWYESAIPEMLSQVVKRTMKRLGVGIVYQKNSYRKIADECLEAMKVCEKVEFKPDRGYIAFNNGLYDLKERRLRDFGEEYRTDIHLDFDYKDGYTHPLWEQKLEEIIPDADMRSALQMFFGCLLLKRDEIKVEYVCVLLGAGGNGKSVLVNAVVNVFGSDLFSTFSPEQLFRSQQSMYHLAELDGKLANFCDDVSNKDFSGGDFKSFVSGAEFEARHPYGSRIFKVKAPFLIFCANEMPPTTDDSEGFHRRFLPILSSTVTRTGAQKDPMLTYKLSQTDVKQAIFNWVLEGYYRVVDCNGNIEVGQSVVETQNQLREDSNSVRRWIRDAGLKRAQPISKNDVNWKSLSEWYLLYKKYCDENGEKSPQKSNSLARVFRSMDFVEERRSGGRWFCIEVDEDGAFGGDWMDGDGLEKKGYEGGVASAKAERSEYRAAAKAEDEVDLPF